MELPVVLLIYCTTDSFPETCQGPCTDALRLRLEWSSTGTLSVTEWTRGRPHKRPVPPSTPVQEKYQSPRLDRKKSLHILEVSGKERGRVVSISPQRPRLAGERRPVSEGGLRLRPSEQVCRRRPPRPGAQTLRRDESVEVVVSRVVRARPCGALRAGGVDGGGVAGSVQGLPSP